MVLLRLNLKLKLVHGAKFCSCDVTRGVQMPAGNSSAAVSLEKERTGEVGVICERANKGQGILDQGMGIVIPP